MHILFSVTIYKITEKIYALVMVILTTEIGGFNAVYMVRVMM